MKRYLYLNPVKLLKLSLLIIIVLIIFSGCFDDEDIDQRMIASPIGIDTAPNQQMLVSIRFPIVRPGGLEHAAGSTPGQKNYILRFITSSGILPAVIDAQNRDEHSVFLGQCRAIIYGESYARQGLKPSLDFLYRLPSLPPNAYIVIAKPTAAEVIDIDWPEQELHDQNIRMFFSNRPNEKYAIKLWSLFQKVYSPLEDPIIPLVSPSDADKTMKLEGMAIFNKDRMVGQFNSEESMILGLIKAPSSRNRIYIPVSGPIATGFEVMSGKKRLKVFYKDNRPTFSFNFKFNAFLTELGDYQGPLKTDQVKQIQQASEEYLEKSILEILRKLQSLKSDPLELGNNLRVQQPKHFSLKNWSRDYNKQSIGSRSNYSLKGWES